MDLILCLKSACGEEWSRCRVVRASQKGGGWESVRCGAHGVSILVGKMGTGQSDEDRWGPTS